MRTKTIPGLFRTLIPFLLLLLLFSCKKTDTGTIESNTGKFFNIKRNVSFETLRCIAELKRQNEITGFIEDLVKQSGFAYWDKALVNRKAVSNASSFSSSQVQGGDTLVFIPLVKENENYVDGFLFFRINGAIEAHLYRANDYDKFAYGELTANELKAENVAEMLLALDKEIFGQRKFDLTDKNLFQFYLNEHDSIKEIPKTVEFVNDQSNGKFIQICYPSSRRVPPTGCYLVSAQVGFEWPEDPPPTTGGGGGGGGCSTCTPPNQNCTPNGNCVIGTQIIEGRLPCGGCGNGPIVILPPEPNIFSDLDIPVLEPQNPLIENGIDISDLTSPTQSQNPRSIGVSPCRGNTEDMEHGLNGNSSGINDPSLLGEPDSWLFLKMNSLFNACTVLESDLRDVGNEMIQRFKDRSGLDYTSTILNSQVNSSNDLINYLKRFGAVLNEQLRSHQGNINAVPSIVMNTRPKFDGAFNKFHGLQILINDTECADIQMDQFEIDSDGKWSMNVTVTIRDHFGLDKNDMITYQDYHPGFPAWWILQHQRDYIPFQTIVKVHKTIKGKM
ncbi:MAG: DUF3289 family protein [Ferruginibacter sp.]